MGERPIPTEGKTIILFEKSEGQRTYSDYLNPTIGLDKLMDVFEKFRENEGLDLEYTLSDIDNWLASFHDIQMMVYDGELGRYTRLGVDKLKDLLHDRVQVAVNSA